MAPEIERRWSRRVRIAGRVIVALLAVGVAILAVRRHEAPELPLTLRVYGFSASEELLREELLPTFRQSWEQRTGRRVEFVASFAGSGEIIRDIARDLPAEVALLASGLDAQRLAQRGLVRGAVWNALPRSGVLGGSPLVLVVRRGNPLDLRGFADLLRPDVRPVLADPVTSGLGEWTLLAVLAALDPAEQERERALERIAAWRAGLPRGATSAREAARRFAAGEGDALVTYAAEREHVGTDAEVLQPEPTVLAEPVLVRLDRNVDEEEREAVDGLIEFLLGPDAEARVAAAGFVVGSASPGARRLEDFGGPSETLRLLARCEPRQDDATEAVASVPVGDQVNQ